MELSALNTAPVGDPDRVLEKQNGAWMGYAILFAICIIWYRIEKGGGGMMQLQREQLDALRIRRELEELLRRKEI